MRPRMPFVSRVKYDSLVQVVESDQAVIHDLSDSVEYYYNLYAEERRNTDVQARKDELVAAALASEERAQKLVKVWERRIANFLAPIPDDDEDSHA